MFYFVGYSGYGPNYRVPFAIVEFVTKLGMLGFIVESLLAYNGAV